MADTIVLPWRVTMRSSGFNSYTELVGVWWVDKWIFIIYSSSCCLLYYLLPILSRSFLLSWAVVVDCGVICNIQLPNNRPPLRHFVLAPSTSCSSRSAQYAVSCYGIILWRTCWLTAISAKHGSHFPPDPYWRIFRPLKSCRRGSILGYWWTYAGIKDT